MDALGLDGGPFCGALSRTVKPIDFRTGCVCHVFNFGLVGYSNDFGITCAQRTVICNDEKRKQP